MKKVNIFLATGLLFGLLFAGRLAAQSSQTRPPSNQPPFPPPYLVEDLNVYTESSHPRNLFNLNGTLFFTFDHPEYGLELWKSDGTAAGITLVKDIFPGGSASPASFFSFNDLLFFSANDGQHGRELWRSDGTAVGTFLVKDTDGDPYEQYLGDFYVLDGTLFFRAGVELWKSDGTASGTIFLTEIPWQETPYSPNWRDMTELDGQLFFVVSEVGKYSSYQAIWRSDGTPAGTVLLKELDSSWIETPLVKVNDKLFYSDQELWLTDGLTLTMIDIHPTDNAWPYNLTAFNDTLYFFADDGTGTALWRSDGTVSGTTLLKPFPAPNGDTPRMWAVNQTLFIVANNGDGSALWQSDGTAAGTTLVYEFGNRAGIRAVMNDLIFLAVSSDEPGFELWRSDGTTAGTFYLNHFEEISNFSFPGPAIMNNQFYFAGKDQNGYELWRSDGTVAGTLMVKDIEPGYGSSYPGNGIADVNGKLFFSAYRASTGNELWQSDGSESGTTLVQDLNTNTLSSRPYGYATLNNQLFFGIAGDNGVLHNRGLWTSDGTAAGTYEVVPESILQFPDQLTELNGRLYFSAFTPTTGWELWLSDGTLAGTTLIKDIRPGQLGANPDQLTALNGRLFFQADYSNGNFWETELWQSDGTVAGTVLLKDINPGGDDRIDNLVTAGDRLFFTADDGVHDSELWVSDGTAAGTFMVKDIHVAGPGWLDHLTNVNGLLFFRAYDGHDYGLWKSDGTEAGTVLLMSAYPERLTAVNHTLFFTANTADFGEELWKSDGTAEGTVLVKDIYQGLGGSYPLNLVNLNGTLFFSAYGPASGHQLWLSDGTEEGTIPANIFVPDQIPEYLFSLLEANGSYYFFLTYENGPTELWQSDGSPEGNQRLAVITGDLGYTPSPMAFANSRLFFTMDDGVRGTEPWAINFDSRFLFLPLLLKP